MAILDIISMEDSRLRAISKPIGEINNQVTNLVEDLMETMESNYAVGLAAPQVGENICLFVIDLDPEKNKSTAFINPSYESIDGSIQLSYEGCLSLGEIGTRLTRLNRIRVNYTDLVGNKMVMDTKGMLSASIQHECDHLEGILFIDYLNKD
ncbi:peptide deformylase [Vibrio sp. Sgm 22]|uniref:peptide deformylase n=1 Tax=unclassified Vibrio TaxID=2614977 RepID=UPI00224997A1|nr:MULTISPECIES: peptide deformylase [unclassified Vibrio]MCX2757775.1 peptide deformylase [Vibrio sp. 14G-20]MCX2774947.1 peptide deformylase [Vibrio sp. Sgm 22]